MSAHSIHSRLIGPTPCGSPAIGARPEDSRRCGFAATHETCQAPGAPIVRCDRTLATVDVHRAPSRDPKHEGRDHRELAPPGLPALVATPEAWTRPCLRCAFQYRGTRFRRRDAGPSSWIGRAMRTAQPSPCRNCADFERRTPDDHRSAPCHGDDVSSTGRSGAILPRDSSDHDAHRHKWCSHEAHTADARTRFASAKGADCDCGPGFTPTRVCAPADPRNTSSVAVHQVARFGWTARGAQRDGIRTTKAPPSICVDPQVSGVRRPVAPTSRLPPSPGQVRCPTYELGR